MGESSDVFKPNTDLQKAGEKAPSFNAVLKEANQERMSVGKKESEKDIDVFYGLVKGYLIMAAEKGKPGLVNPDNGQPTRLGKWMEERMSEVGQKLAKTDSVAERNKDAHIAIIAAYGIVASNLGGAGDIVTQSGIAEVTNKFHKVAETLYEYQQRVGGMIVDVADERGQFERDGEGRPVKGAEFKKVFNERMGSVGLEYAKKVVQIMEGDSEADSIDELIRNSGLSNFAEIAMTIAPEKKMLQYGLAKECVDIANKDSWAPYIFKELDIKEIPKGKAVGVLENKRLETVMRVFNFGWASIQDDRANFEGSLKRVDVNERGSVFTSFDLMVLKQGSLPKRVVQLFKDWYEAFKSLPAENKDA